jgi:hypothetical protein
MSWVTDASAALTFVWVGLIAGISFLEAPLKFRAPGVTIPLGLGIGRLVFRALNRVELVLAVLITAGALVGASDRLWPHVLAIAALVVLLVQLIFVRPALNRRSDAVLAGGEHETRSRTHLWYVGLEVVKLGVLIALGVVLLRG